MSLDRLRSKLASPARSDDGIVTRVQQTVCVTAAEIRQAVEAHPNHPLAGAFSNAIDGRPPRKALFVDRIDLLGVADNVEVVVETVVVDGVARERKALGESLAPKTKALPTQSEPIIEDGVPGDSGFDAVEDDAE